jgi:hypothetical protein
MRLRPQSGLYPAAPSKGAQKIRSLIDIVMSILFNRIPTFNYSGVTSYRMEDLQYLVFYY